MKTPEQTLSDLLALGEKWKRGGYSDVTQAIRVMNEFFVASGEALPALREYMEVVKVMRTVCDAAKDFDDAYEAELSAGEDELRDGSDIQFETYAARMALQEALSRLGGK